MPTFGASYTTFVRNRKFKRFSAQKQVISKKKKGLHRNWDGFFGRNRKFKPFFRPKTGDLQKKNNKVFTEIETDFSADIGNSNSSSARIRGNSFTTSSPNPFWGGLFFEQKSASKALKTCDFAYFSGQWGWAGAPPWLRYWAHNSQLQTSQRSFNLCGDGRSLNQKCLLSVNSLINFNLYGLINFKFQVLEAVVVHLSGVKNSLSFNCLSTFLNFCTS